jgi:hypothetical protein
MDQLAEIRNAAALRWNIHNQEKQKVAQERVSHEHKKIEYIEISKMKLNSIGKKIHNCNEIQNIHHNLNDFTQLLSKCLPQMSEYDIDDVRSIIVRIFSNFDEIVSHVNIIHDRHNIEILKKNIRELLKKVELDENLIQIEIHMDTDEDENVANLLSNEEKIQTSENDFLYAQFLSGIQLGEDDITKLLLFGYNL